MVRSHPGSLFYQAFSKGPLIFLIYIKNVVLGIDSEMCLFADDCNI